MPPVVVLTTKPMRCSVTPVVVVVVVAEVVADVADVAVAVVAVDGTVAVETVGEVAAVVEALDVPDVPDVLDVLDEVEVATLVAEDVGSVEGEDVVLVVEVDDFVGAVVSKRSQPAAKRHRSDTARMMLMSRTTIRVGLSGMKRDMISTSFPESRRPGTGLAR